MAEHIQWPEGKSFAFSVFDDTDLQTLENVREVYAFLADLGLRTTKSVWPIRGVYTPKLGGKTCEDEAYRRWVLDLQAQGFEIGLHNVTYHTSLRADTKRGLERFHDIFGHYPYGVATHSGCHEGMYWGNYRLSGIHEVLYNVLLRNRYKGVFQGHIEDSPLFWGDLCQEKTKYVRNFVFDDINTLNTCPMMPYHDPSRPFVNYWFASSEGAKLISFNTLLSESNQDRLEAEGGACIVYTHFAEGFYANGHLDPRFQSLMERVSQKNGWFVPVQQLLDYLLEHKIHTDISPQERTWLERKWLKHKIFNTRGTS